LFRPDAERGGHRIARPGEVAAFLNERFQLDTRLAQYFTIIYGVLDVPARRFDYVAAGHPGPVHVPAGGAARVLSSTATPIGLLPSVEFDEASLTLEPGDRFYLYTDGVTEAVDARDEELGQERFARSLEGSRGDAVTASLERVLTDLDEWRGGEPATDDVSLLGARMR
jgi:sigma-B regulation protein RsbU (phosphoserine phosphatase)